MSTVTDRSTPRRRILLALVAVTALVLAVDLSGATDLEPVRRAAATVLGPLERLVGPGGGEVSALRAQNLELSTRLSAAERDAGGTSPLAAVLAEPALAGAVIVSARVVAVGASGPAGPERVTIDVGARDGVQRDRAVVAEGGLVGRVVSVAPWTSDVLLLGSPDLAIGVRVGRTGVLGQASGSAIDGGARPQPGALSVALIETGAMRPGDAVSTLGSIGGSPYPPGLRIGTISWVEEAVGKVSLTGTLTPSVDTTSIDVVAVVLTTPRSTPRPTVTVGSG